MSSDHQDPQPLQATRHMSLFEMRLMCPLCGYTNLTTLLKRVFSDSDFQSFLKLELTYSNNYYSDMRNGLLNDQLFRIVKCKTCGFIFQQCVLNTIGMKKLYNDRMDPNKVKIFTTSSANLLKLIASYIHRLQYVQAYFNNKPIRLMDWGAGIGLFSKLANDRPNFDAAAYDFSVAKNKKLTQCKIKTKTIGDLREKQFHFINIDQVLEHVTDPVVLLKKCSEVLVDDGLIFVSTPNCISLKRLIKQNTLNHQLHEYLSPHQHINAFTNKTIKVAAGYAGLKTVLNPFLQINTSVYFSQTLKMNLNNLVKPFYRQWLSTSFFCKTLI